MAKNQYEDVDVTDIPAADRAIIMPGKDWKTTGYEEASNNITHGRMLNVANIIETGKVDLYPGIVSPLGASAQDFTITIDKDPSQAPSDALNTSINSVQENVLKAIEQSESMQTLLQKDSWTMDDRIAYEKELSQIVSNEVAMIPGLDQYRSMGESKSTNNMNDLSQDITTGSHDLRYDCGRMAVLEGIVLQQVEQAILPDTAPDGDQKQSQNYFVQSGSIKNMDVETPGGLYGIGGLHAWVVSSATGGIIEATAAQKIEYVGDVKDDIGPTPYRLPINNEGGFQDRVEGKPALFVAGFLQNELGYYASDTSIVGMHTSEADVGPALRDMAMSTTEPLKEAVLQSTSSPLTTLTPDNITAPLAAQMEQDSNQLKAALSGTDALQDFSAKWALTLKQHADNPSELKEDFKVLEQELDKLPPAQLTQVSSDGASVTIVELKEIIGASIAEKVKEDIPDAKLPGFMKVSDGVGENIEISSDASASISSAPEGTIAHADFSTTPLSANSNITIQPSDSYTNTVVQNILPASQISVMQATGEIYQLDQLQNNVAATPAPPEVNPMDMTRTPNATMNMG